MERIRLAPMHPSQDAGRVNQFFLRLRTLADADSDTRTRKSAYRFGAEVRPLGKLLHVTNLLSKEGISVQIRWTYCNKANNFQCCQYHSLIRVLPDEPDFNFPP